MAKALPARLTALATALTLVSPVAAETTAKKQPDPQRAYERVVQKVANMIDSDAAYRVASSSKLQLLNVLWEDTGRWEGSSVGPNISDVTIEVEGYRNGKAHRTYLMPVMRHDNFVDKTADVKIDKIMIPIGNQRPGDGKLELISLAELLQNPAQYMSSPDKGKIKGENLLAKRDTHVLVSAQHAFLPVPKEGKATFWPVIFNYQSAKKNPAVLTILVTRQGTSMTIIDNARDTVTGDSWGQRLYFNKGGEKAPLIAERLADVKASGVTANGEDAQDLTEDANVLMLIQVPLKYRAPVYYAPKAGANKDYSIGDLAGATATKGYGGGAAAPAAVASESRRAAEAPRSDVDTAVLGHGPTEGPYTELAGLTIARDPRFPIRVTLQFYQATSNGVISRDNVKSMAAQIKKVYGKGDYVGSLVVPSGLDRVRPTNWTGSSAAPAYVDWSMFPGLIERMGTMTTLPPPVTVRPSTDAIVGIK
jgi:hypothetical protein